MNAETLKALEGSIEHWRRLADGVSGENEGYTGESCALCSMFANGDADCVGCPVMATTGQPQCDGTPWWTAYVTWSRFGKNSTQFFSAAKIQLAFLESLLPKTTEATAGK